MNQTKLMRADEIANGFNSVEDRKYWRAVVAGTRVNPEVNFHSRASMVVVTYRVSSNDFTVSFSRANAAFGDFLASIQRSMGQVLVALKASGLPFAAPLNDIGRLRLEYEPATKDVVIRMAGIGDPWLDAEPLPFKDPVRKKEDPASETTIEGVDATSTAE